MPPLKFPVLSSPPYCVKFYKQKNQWSSTGIVRSTRPVSTFQLPKCHSVPHFLIMVATNMLVNELKRKRENF